MHDDQHSRVQQGLDVITPTRGHAAMRRYACIRCRLRKVKCDRSIAGCDNCVKFGVPCTFSPRRNAQKLHYDAEPRTRRELVPAVEETSTGQHFHNIKLDKHLTTYDETESDGDADIIMPREMRDNSFEKRCDSEKSSGRRLLVGQGKTRYVNGDKADQVCFFDNHLCPPPCPSECGC
jgi:hypothetical protein